MDEHEEIVRPFRESVPDEWRLCDEHYEESLRAEREATEVLRAIEESAGQ